jgi:hypothetical protein
MCFRETSGLLPQMLPQNASWLLRSLDFSEPGWDRTSDLLIKSQLLYH